MDKQPTKILIVDDSALVRQVLRGILSEVPDFEVIGAAQDPIFAMRMMDKQWPDLIVLDIEMPRMDGITFLKKIMAERPTPVVICSTLTEKGTEVAMEAMSAGAVDIITKPKMALKQFLHDSHAQLIDTLKAARHARAHRNTAPARRRPAAVTPLPRPTAEKLSADAVLPASAPAPMSETTDKVIAIGASNGGTRALETVLTALPGNAPGIVIVQHMPEKFTAAFAARLNGLCAMQISEAQNNDRVLPGQVLIAPGGQHMLLRRSGAQYRVEIKDGPLVSRHKPSVDVLFRSVAQSAGANAVGVILTGMGDDGAAGMLEMRKAGAFNIGQDEASCVVYGMPKEAHARGGVSQQLPLEQVAEWIVRAGNGERLSAAAQ